jgi:hypothetical protein
VKSVRSFRLSALATVALGGLTSSPGTATDASAQDAGIVESLDRLAGPAWLARGDDFTSVLTYAWVVPGRVMTRERILFADGEPVRHDRGAYQLDPVDGDLEFWIAGPDGERHEGEVEPGPGGLWHLGRVVDGRSYRALVTVRSDTVMEHGSLPGGPGAPDGLVPRSGTLVYRRLSRAAVREAAAEERSYMTRGAGEWGTPNPGAGSGPDTPERFLYRSRVAGDALRVDIAVELADGRSFTAWRIVSSYDADAGVIRMHQVGSDGALLEGRMDPLPDGTTIVRMDGTGPGGADITFMDRNIRDGPDTFRSVSWLLRDGAWQESMRSTWRRVGSPPG